MGQPVRVAAMQTPAEIRLDGSASRFLTLLVDFGHLDEDALRQVFLLLGDMAIPQPGGGPVRVGVNDVRRAAAAVLFDRDPVSPHLFEDWPLLFS